MSFSATQLIGFMGGGKTFPTVLGTNTGGTALASTYDVPLPSSIPAGALLLMFITGRTNAARSFTIPTGWSELYNVVGSSNLRRAVCYYRTADGTEGATVTVATVSGSIVYSTITYCISGAGTTPEAGTASGSSSGPDSPSLSPTWGLDKTLFISASHGHINTATDPTIPSGYSGGVFKAQLDGSYSVVDTAQLNSEAATEDPGAWGYAASGPWVAATVAINPA